MKTGSLCSLCTLCALLALFLLGLKPAFCVNANSDTPEIAPSFQEHATDKREKPLKSGPNDYFGSAVVLWRADWRPHRLPVKIFIDNSSPGDKCYKPEWKQMLYDSFLEWESATDGLLKVKRVDKEDDADIVCHWLAHRSQLNQFCDARIYSYGYTSVRGVGLDEKHEPDDATMYIVTCRDERAGIAYTDRQMKSICLNQAGRVLGIQGNSPDPLDAMGKPLRAQQLSDRDRNTIKRLYSLRLDPDRP